MKHTNFRVIDLSWPIHIIVAAGFLLSLVAMFCAETQAAGPQQGASTTEKWDDLSPEQKMQRRFPQPILVGDLIGLPILDENDSTMGYVRHVVRTPEGKIQLIVPHGGFFGWRARLVAVPIEVVGMLGRQVATLEFDRKAFDAAPTWSVGSSLELLPKDSIVIALHKR